MPIRILTALFLLAILLHTGNQIRDYDTYYHLATGRYIWETKSIPTSDVFSYTAPGGPWVTHEWLAQLLFFWIFELAGAWGLVAFAAAIAALTYWLLLRLASLFGASVWIAAPFLFLTGYLTFELWVPRPQIFSYLLLAGELYLLELYRRKGDGRLRAAVAGMILLWANLHASVLLGLGVLAIYAAAEFLRSRLPFLGTPLPPERVKGLALTAAAGFLLSFVNPNTYHVHLYPIYIQPVIRALNTLEWSPLTAFLHIPQARIFLGILVAISAFMMVRFLRHTGGRDPVALGMVLLAAVFPFLSVRHVGYVPILAAPFLLSELVRVPIPWRGRLLSWFAPAGKTALLLLFAAWAGNGYLTRAGEPVNRHTLSIGAADFIAEQGVPPNGFAFSNDGGYLMWRLWPEHKVFIDGRSETYAGEPVREFLRIARMEDGWENLVNEKYGINYFLLWYKDPLAQVVAPLATRLMTQEGFHLVYWDDAAILLVRERPDTEDIIAEFGFRRISPFIDPASAPPEIREEIADEIGRLLTRSEDSESAQAYARRFIQGQ